ncbi:MAG: Cys-tRNA(Pro) deacylase [Pirellulales bacterium]|nr:Cys-tRNA(Pro) deacylase [Pirellulales bacterium]
MPPDRISKTNAARLLDAKGIEYELRFYEFDPEDLSSDKVAAQIGLPHEQVYKTLVAKGDRHGVLLAVLPGDAELDLKALAKLSGNRRVEMAPLKEVQALTGYIRGGVTALGCKRNYPVYLEEEVILFDRISVSAGVRGTQILLSPDNYISAVDATLGAIIRPR